MKMKLHINGMTCQKCIRHVKEALSEDIPGCYVLEINLDEKYAVVEITSDVSNDKFKEVISDVGYVLIGVE